MGCIQVALENFLLDRQAFLATRKSSSNQPLKAYGYWIGICRITVGHFSHFLQAFVQSSVSCCRDIIFKSLTPGIVYMGNVLPLLKCIEITQLATMENCTSDIEFVV